MIRINEAIYIEKKEFFEDDDDILTIRVVGEDNMNELINYLKDYNRKIH